MTPAEQYARNIAEWSDVQEHLPRFREAARGYVLEIGVRTGMSTSAFLAGVEENGGHLWSVDIEDCSRLFPDHPQWTFLHADSILHSRFLLETLPRELELLFVDGDHTEEGCLSDLNTYGPRARRIMVHDTSAPNFPGVRRAVLDYVSHSRRICRFLEESYGLAVIE